MCRKIKAVEYVLVSNLEIFRKSKIAFGLQKLINLAKFQSWQFWKRIKQTLQCLCSIINLSTNPNHLEVQDIHAPTTITFSHYTRRPCKLKTTRWSYSKSVGSSLVAYCKSPNTLLYTLAIMLYMAINIIRHNIVHMHITFLQQWLLTSD